MENFVKFGQHKLLNQVNQLMSYYSDSYKKLQVFLNGREELDRNDPGPRLDPPLLETDEHHSFQESRKKS